MLTYGTHACITHAFRRYCYKRLDSLRQQRPKAANVRPGGGGAGGEGGSAGSAQRWWVEKDKGIELSAAQIEMRLLASRALHGGWDEVIQGGEGSRDGSHGPGLARAVGPSSQGPSSKEGSKESPQRDGGKADTDECIVIEDDKASPSKAGGHGGDCGDCGADRSEAGDGGGASLPQKPVLKRVAVGAECNAGDVGDSDDDDLPLAIKQQKFRDARRAARKEEAGEEADEDSCSSASHSSSSSSSSSSASSVSCPSPTSMAAAAAANKGGGSDHIAPAASSSHQNMISTSAEPPLKKLKGEDGAEESVCAQLEAQQRGKGEAQANTAMEEEERDREARDAAATADVQLACAVLGVTREIVRGWAGADLEMLAEHLSEHDTGELSLRDLAKQGLFEAFVVAVRNLPV